MECKSFETFLLQNKYLFWCCNAMYFVEEHFTK